MKVRLYIIFILISLAGSAGAQTFNEKIYSSYLKGDLESWEKILESTPSQFPNLQQEYDVALAHYGFIGYCISRSQKSRARPFLERAEAMADDLIEKSHGDPRYLSLRGALYGFRISFQPQRAMFIGPKAQKVINLAFEKDPDCPQALIELGNKEWFMPPIFGGSKTDAIAYYERAIRTFEKDPAWMQKNWYYLNVNMLLANWYQVRGRTFAAHEVYRKLLQMEPDFVSARKELK